MKEMVLAMIPVEVRKIIILDREAGMTVKEISHVLNVSESAIYSTTKKYKERGNLNGKYPGRKPMITNE